MAQLTLKETVPSPLVLRDMLEEMAVKELQGPAQGDEEEVSERIRDRYLVGILAPRQRAEDMPLPLFEKPAAPPAEDDDNLEGDFPPGEELGIEGVGRGNLSGDDGPTELSAPMSKAVDVIRNKGYNSRMMTYATLQSDRREFLALTGLTLQEFQLLLNAFTPAYERRYPKDRTLADRPRQRCAGGGRKGVLDSPEQKLLFLLVYLKTYPLQVLMGELFGLSQPGVNYWIHRLLPVLRDALDSLSVLPERNPNDFARSQTATGTEPRLIIDGTERRRQRPKSPEKQALHYSGKKKAHTDKNVVIVDLRRKCIGFLSRTYVGKTHDKKIADSEGISYPPKAELYKDTGFQGYEPAVRRTCQAKKKPPRGELTAAEKRTNRKLARIRVNVEHALAGVKRSRIVKDVLRNTKDGVSDSAMEAACGLHNLRVQNRKRPLRR